MISRSRSLKFRAAFFVCLLPVTALPAQTLVGYYNFNQTGSPITDQAANPADMSGTGSPGYNQAAIPGQSFGATGSLTDGSSYWSNSAASKYTNLLNDFTVMAWINPTNVNGVGGHNSIIFGTTNGDNKGWAVGINGTDQLSPGQPFYVNYGINSYDLGVGSTQSQLANNTWVNLAVTKSSTAGVSFFINGTYVGTATGGGTESAQLHNGNDWLIGNGADMARNFVGSIDELRIYNGVLNQSQIQSISAIPEPSTYAALCGIALLAFAGWRRHGCRIKA